MGIKVMSYDDYVGLMLNIGRLRARRTWEMVDAYNITHSSENLDYGWFTAITATDAEAEEMAEEENSARQDQRTRQQVSSMFGVDI